MVALHLCQAYPTYSLQVLITYSKSYHSSNMTKLFMHRHNHQPSSPPHNAMFLSNSSSAIIIPGLQLCACSAPAGTLWGTQAGDCIKYIKGQRQGLWSLVFGESHLTTFPNPKDQIQFRQNLSQRNPMELSHFTNMLTHRQE